MNTIWQVYQFMLFLVDYYRSGEINNTEASYALWAGQQDLFNEYWGDGTLPQASIEALAPFSRTLSVTTDANGAITLPAGHVHTRLITTGIGNTIKTYRQVLHTELDSALKSQMYSLEKYPRWMEDAGAIKLFPARSTMATLYYYVAPTPPVIAVTMSGNDAVYDDANSVQLGFRKNYWNEVVGRAMPYIGLNLSKDDLLGFSKQYAAPRPS